VPIIGSCYIDDQARGIWLKWFTNVETESILEKT